MPGKVAVKICPDVLKIMAQNVTTVIVTGTNGKTTTSRMIEQCLINDGKNYFSNKSGANLLTGITCEFANNSDIFGRCRKDTALIECDEAAFKQVSKYVNAKYVVVTNIFRDQLDRFGEITHTLNSIKIGVNNSPEAVVCLNADCSLTTSIAFEIPNKTIYYGVNAPIYNDLVKEISDAKYCIKCKNEYEYDYITYGHLGKYRCPVCGYERPDTTVSAVKIKENALDSSLISIDINGEEWDLRVNLPGGHNIYNAVSAAAIASAMGIENKKIIDALSSFECGFGRMENFRIGGKDVRMILVKNPAGCNQVLNFLTNSVNEPCVFVTVLNDKLADGTDISWIWDVNFEKLEKLGDNLPMVYVSGIRADDMAMRIKYAGRDTDKISIIKDFDRLIDELEKEKLPVYVMPTYTAMLDLRERISKRFDFKNYWEN